MNEDNYIKELYERFVQDMKDGLAMGGYDRDELLEIYDYATDVYDDYTRLQVLLTGAREYPRDRELRERKAYFVFDIGDMAGANRAVEEIKVDSFLKELLLIRLEQGTPEESARKLDDLLSRQRKGGLNDEEVIKLVDAVVEMKLFDWLEKRYDTIKQCAEFPDTVMYECSDVAVVENKYTLAIKSLEDLTADQPFNEEFWLSLASSYYQLSGFCDKALSALDYALAINPSSHQGLLMKAGYLVEQGDNYDEAVAIFEEIEKDAPDFERAYVVHSSLLIDLHRKDEAVALLKGFLKRNPDNVTVFDQLIFATNSADSREDVKTFVERLPSVGDDEMMMSLVDRYVEDCRFGSVVAFIEGVLLVGVEISRRAVSLLLESQCRIRHFEDAVETFKRYFSDKNGFEPESTDRLCYCLALRMTGRISEMVEQVEIERTRPKDLDTLLEDKLKTIGQSYYFLQILHSIKGEVPEDNFNPFI